LRAAAVATSLRSAPFSLTIPSMIVTRRVAVTVSGSGFGASAPALSSANADRHAIETKRLMIRYLWVGWSPRRAGVGRRQAPRVIRGTGEWHRDTPPPPRRGH